MFLFLFLWLIYLSPSSSSWFRNQIDQSKTEISIIHPETSCFSTTFPPSLTSCEAISDSHRSLLSVRMTLCDLKTGGLKIPKECNSLSSSPDPKLKYLQECVESLSRSPQHWSSYAGYLREVTQFCYATARRKEIDEAKEVWRNVSVESKGILKMMKAVIQQWEQGEESRDKERKEEACSFPKKSCFNIQPTLFSSLLKSLSYCLSFSHLSYLTLSSPLQTNYLTRSEISLSQ
jgi:hypothetical protein